MNRYRITVILALTTITALWVVGAAFADTATTTRSDGYQVSLTGPTTAVVGAQTAYTATCGPVGWYGSPCPYGEFRAFGGVINRLGEGFGRGAMGSYVFRAPGYYSVLYRVGASCPGSPRLACPIDVWLYVAVTA
jgi:hypothetical protein